MQSFAFNWVTVAVGAFSLIVIISALLPQSMFDRFADWVWRSDSSGAKPDQQWPWEKR
jgi:hypothetical protein